MNLTEWHSTGFSPGSVPSLAFFLSISSIFFSARSMCLCLVVIVFVMFCQFCGLVGWLCQLPFLFPRVPSMSNTPRIISNLGKSHRMAFHWALSWKYSQPCILPFYFFHFLFSKKHVFMFGCHWFCHVLSILWAGWVVVSAAFFVSKGSEHVEYP